MEITYADLERWGACNRETRYTEAACLALTGGREAIEPEDVFDLDIPTKDKLWLLLRPECIPEPTLHLLACDFAEHMLPADCDPRSRAALEVKRRWVNGRVTGAELTAAVAAARVADYAARAAWEAATVTYSSLPTRDAADYASWAAGYAVWAADYAGRTPFGALTAGYANRDEILQWQLERVREVLGMTEKRLPRYCKGSPIVDMADLDAWLSAGGLVYLSNSIRPVPPTFVANMTFLTLRGYIEKNAIFKARHNT